MAREILGDSGGKPYSLGTRVGNMIFVSGQLGLDANENVVPGGIGPETRQTLENLKAVLAQADATLDDVTMVNVYLKDLDADYATMNQIYRAFFGDQPPARATVQVGQAGLQPVRRDLVHRRVAGVARAK